MSGPYDDIINLPHHVSKKHPQMSIHDRAAQFAPFAALTGHEEAIEETARLTDARIEIDDGRRLEINQKLIDSFNTGKRVSIRFFVPDNRKEGGEYREYTGYITKLDTYGKRVFMSDSKDIGVENNIKNKYKTEIKTEIKIEIKMENIESIQ